MLLNTKIEDRSGSLKIVFALRPSSEEKKGKAILKRSRLAMFLFFVFFILSLLILSGIVPSGDAGGPAILHVSLPAGEDRTGISDPDPWLNECWLLNINGTSGTFTVKIEDVSGSISSYDTHLIVALNDIAYSSLVGLIVDNITIAKSDLKHGTPRPCNLWDWPSGDIYPAWFNGALVNVGTINPKGHTNVTVSVAFSDATGVRVHFDAYGSTKSYPLQPTKKCHITHNPLSEDSTVLFWPPPLIPPLACFSVSNDKPNVCETVTFNASCSCDPDGWIVDYTWNFGDGNTTTVNYPIIVHHYDTFGNYTVTLTVTDNYGLTNSTFKKMCIRGHPRADFTWSPISPQVGEPVTFNASVSRPDGGTIISYQWDFGDASPYNFGKFATHTYTTYGTYEVTLNVTDSECKWDTEVKKIVVRAHPKADFVWSPTQPEENQTVTFDSSSSTPNGGTIVTYNWNFGDGKSGTGKIVTHVYTTAGTYIVVLNITDSEGKWDARSKQITVKSSSPHPKPVGGHATSIDKHHLLAPKIGSVPEIGFVLVLIGGIAITIFLTRHRNKK